eukprot:g5887.t1
MNSNTTRVRAERLLGQRITQLNRTLKAAEELVSRVSCGEVTVSDAQACFVKFCSEFRESENELRRHGTLGLISRAMLSKLQGDYNRILLGFQSVSKRLTFAKPKLNLDHLSKSSSSSSKKVNTVRPKYNLNDNDTLHFQQLKSEKKTLGKYTPSELSQIQKIAEESAAIKEIFSDLRSLVAADRLKIEAALDEAEVTSEITTKAKKEIIQARESQKSAVAKKLPTYNAGAGTVIGGVLGFAGGPPGAVLGAAVGAGVGAGIGSLWAWAANNRNSTLDTANAKADRARARKSEFRLRTPPVVEVRESFTVVISIPEDLRTDEDWIGLYNGSEKPHKAFVSWRRVSEEKAKRGKFQWYRKHAPTHAGRWQLRYFHGNSTTVPLAVSHFTVRLKGSGGFAVDTPF